MLLAFLLTAHIAVLGYWLGSEFVINSSFRYVCYSADMPFAERSRLLQHVMNTDQHVRYALILQFTLGTILAILLGYIPVVSTYAYAVLFFGIFWLALVEVTHRLRQQPLGIRLAQIDRTLRYLLIFIFAVLPVAMHMPWSHKLPQWLVFKLACFAGVIACGVFIRLVIIKLFSIWKETTEEDAMQMRETAIRTCYFQSTAALLLLWFFIICIALLSIWKPQ